MRVHFIGIGGSGLSAIARLLLERGYEVSGSDLVLSPLAQRLQKDGARVFIGHQRAHVHGADLVIRSSAVPDDNVEVQAARQLGIPVLKRADYLGQMMADRMGIAVAGTHGKTTTTAMVAWCLTALNQDPTFIVGGVLDNLGTNARAGDGPAFVIEADEYDSMFLGLRPSLAVVTNIEHDHPDLYPTPESYHQAFVQFTERLPEDGTLLVCRDDPGARRLAGEVAPKVHKLVTYGLEGDPTYQGRNLRMNNRSGYLFDLVSGDRLFVKVGLRVPGRHNVQNAVAALAVIDLLDLSVTEAAQALADFRGTGRRFQIRGEVGGVTVIDDYAHHPTEIRATLQAARMQYPGRRLWAVWQPHTYDRTRTFFDAFTRAFAQADRVLVTEIYAARGQVPAGYSAHQVVDAMEHPGKEFVPGLDKALQALQEHVEPGDVVLVLSAGDADQISPRLLDYLSRHAQPPPNGTGTAGKETQSNWR